MRTDDVRIVGLAELERALKTLPDKIQRNVMRAGLAAGARVIRDMAKMVAPRRSGALVQSIRTSWFHGVALVKAGNRKKRQAWYASIVHTGARPHRIRPRTGGSWLYFGGRYVREVQHPGFAGNPFLENVLGLGADSAVRAMGAKISERLRSEHSLNVPAPATFDE